MTDQKLTPDATKAINAYLRKWMIAGGVVNVTVLLAIFGFVSKSLVRIEQTATEHALEAARKRVDESTEIESLIRESVQTSVTDVASLSRLQGEAKARLRTLDQSLATMQSDARSLRDAISKAEPDIQALEESVATLRSDNNLRTIQAINQFFLKNPQAADDLRNLNQLVRQLNTRIVAFELQNQELQKRQEKTAIVLSILDDRVSRFAPRPSVIRQASGLDMGHR